MGNLFLFVNLLTLDVSFTFPSFDFVGSNVTSANPVTIVLDDMHKTVGGFTEEEKIKFELYNENLGIRNRFAYQSYASANLL